MRAFYIAAFVPVSEALKTRRYVSVLQVAAPAELVCDICGDVLRPPFGGIEADDPLRVVILPREQVLDDCI